LGVSLEETCAMKTQSLLFLAAPERGRSPFLWAVALRVRQQSQRREGIGSIGPIAEPVHELSRRQCVTNQD
jgi:hypothetical protein